MSAQSLSAVEPPLAASALELRPQELEAERAWWCEASERQVKELESSFGTAFRSTADKLRSDLSSCQERLERLLEAEKKQRNELMAELSESTSARLDRVEALLDVQKGRKDTDVQDLKRNLDTQQLLLTELARQHQEMLGLEPKMEQRLQEVLREMPRGEQGEGGLADLCKRLRCDLDSFSLQASAKDANFKAEWAHHKVQVASLQRDLELLQAKTGGTDAVEAAALQDMRKDLAELRRELKQLQEGATPKALETTVLDIRREVASLQEQPRVQLVEASVADMRKELEELRRQEALPAVEASVRELRRDLTALVEAQSAQDATPHVDDMFEVKRELERLHESQLMHQQHVQEQGPRIQDLRQELANLWEAQALQQRQAREELLPLVETKVLDLRQELAADQQKQALETTREELRSLQASLSLREQQIEDLRSSAASTLKSHEDSRAFQDVVMQSTADLSRGLEEISRTVLVSEEKLRRELEALKLEAGSRSCEGLLQQSCEKNSVELTALKALTEAVSGDLASLREALPTTVSRADLERLGMLLDADVRKLHSHVEAVEERMRSAEAARGQLTEVEAAQKGLEEALNRRMTEALVQERASMAVQLAELRQRVEAPSAGVQRPELEELLSRRLSDALSKERAAVATQLANLWQLVEATNAAAKHQAIVVAPPVQEVKSMGFDQSAAVEEIKSDLCVLQMAVQVLEKRYHEAPKDDSLSSRVDHAEGEMKRVMNTMVILSSRVDTFEAEVWKSTQELPTFTTRLELVEADMKKLAREGGTLSADVGVLRMLVETWHQRYEGAEKRAAGKGSEGLRLLTQSPGSPQLPTRQSSEVEGRMTSRGLRGTPSSVTAVLTSSTATMSPSNTIFEPRTESGSLNVPTGGSLTAELQQNISSLVQRIQSKPQAVGPGMASSVQQALQNLREKNTSLREMSSVDEARPHPQVKSWAGSNTAAPPSVGPTPPPTQPSAAAICAVQAAAQAAHAAGRPAWPPRAALPSTARSLSNLGEKPLQGLDSKGGSMLLSPGAGSPVASAASGSSRLTSKTPSLISPMPQRGRDRAMMERQAKSAMGAQHSPTRAGSPLHGVPRS